MIIIALGANLPFRASPPQNAVLAALDALADAGIKVEARSRLYRCPAWPDPTDPPFVNAVARLATELSPTELLKLLHAVEASFGRRRSVDPVRKNAPRTLDLDLIDYNGLVQPGPPALPHPRMVQRAFVLLPLRDVAPDWNHPENGRLITALITALGPEARVPQIL